MCVQEAFSPAKRGAMACRRHACVHAGVCGQMASGHTWEEVDGTILQFCCGRCQQLPRQHGRRCPGVLCSEIWGPDWRQYLKPISPHLRPQQPSEPPPLDLTALHEARVKQYDQEQEAVQAEQLLRQSSTTKPEQYVKAEQLLRQAEQLIEQLPDCTAAGSHRLARGKQEAADEEARARQAGSRLALTLGKRPGAIANRRPQC